MMGSMNSPSDRYKRTHHFLLNQRSYKDKSSPLALEKISVAQADKRSHLKMILRQHFLNFS
jgi:hypothetical protein